MAITLTTNYAGEVYQGILTQLLQGDQLIAGGHVMLQTGINDVFHIPKFALSAVIQDPKAEIDISADSVGDLTSTEITLDPKQAMVFMKFNPNAFRSFWKQYQPDGPLLFKKLPAAIQSKLLGLIMNRISSYIGVANVISDVGGGATYAGEPLKYWDGFLTRMRDNALGGSPTINLVPQASIAVLTESNIVDKLKIMKTQIYANQAIRMRYSDPNFKYFMSPQDADLYRSTQVTAEFKGVGLTETGLNKFDGKPVVPLEGIPKDVIFATVGGGGERSNLWVGVNDTKDDSTIQVDKTAPYNETYFVKMQLEFDTQIPYFNEVILYDDASVS